MALESHAQARNVGALEQVFADVIRSNLHGVNNLLNGFFSLRASHNDCLLVAVIPV